MGMSQPVLSRKSKDVKASLEIAKSIIREKIDGDGKFEAGALYEMTGHQLSEYLAFAFREGVNGREREGVIGCANTTRSSPRR